MRPTAIGAPAPEPDDEPTLEELIDQVKAHLADWHIQNAAMAGQHAKLMAQIESALAKAGSAGNEQEWLRAQAEKEEDRIRRSELRDLLKQVRHVGHDLGGLTPDGF